MKVLLSYIGTPSPVLEIELELIQHHLDALDEVLVVQCNGRLPNCHWNNERSEIKCFHCRSRFDQGIKLLKNQQKLTIVNFKGNSTLNKRSIKHINSIDEIKQFKYDGVNLGIGAASSLISKLRDHQPKPEQLLRNAERELNTSIAVYEEIKSHMAAFKPDRTYYFNGRITTHYPIRVLCDQLGMPHASYEVSNRNNCYRLKYDKSIHAQVLPNEVDQIKMEWNDDKSEVANQFFLDLRHRNTKSKLQIYTSHQKKGELPQFFLNGKKVIAIFNSTIDEYAAFPEWDNHIYKPNETSGIRKIVESFANENNYIFILRVHPNLRGLSRDQSQLKEIKKLELHYDNLYVIWPEETIDTYALLENCEKVVSFGSTIGAEATYWGKPSILAGRCNYELFDCAYVVRSHEELVELIKREIPPKPKLGALQYSYWINTDAIKVFRYFKEIGNSGGYGIGLFNGHHVRASIFARMLLSFLMIPDRIFRLYRNPRNLIKLRRYLSVKYWKYRIE